MKSVLTFSSSNTHTLLLGTVINLINLNLTACSMSRNNNNDTNF
jgi:hypothetical protein